MDLKLDMKDSRDLVFVNGECPVTESYADSTAQRVFVMLRTFQDEWYLNSETGVPWIPQILGTKASKGTVDRIIQEKILQEVGVAEIVSFNSYIDNKRGYNASFTAKVTSGETFSDNLTVSGI